MNYVLPMPGHWGQSLETFLWKATPCAGTMPTSMNENVKMHWPLIQCGMTVWAPQKGLERARITPLTSAHKLVSRPSLEA